jgi:hypothetical protein
VFIPFQPLSETKFTGHDLASAKNMKISFELAGGSAKSLTVLGKTKMTALKRQSFVG